MYFILTLKGFPFMHHIVVAYNFKNSSSISFRQVNIFKKELETIVTENQNDREDT